MPTNFAHVITIWAIFVLSLVSIAFSIPVMEKVSFSNFFVCMKAFEIIMTCILGACAAYIICCLYKASRYLREHPEEFRWTDVEDPRK